MIIEWYRIKPWPIMLKILLIMLLSSAQKMPIMLNIMPITTAIMPQFLHNFIVINDYISMVGLQADVFYNMLCCSVLIFDILCS